MGGIPSIITSATTKPKKDTEKGEKNLNVLLEIFTGFNTLSNVLIFLVMK